MSKKSSEATPQQQFRVGIQSLKDVESDFTPRPTLNLSPKEREEFFQWREERQRQESACVCCYGNDRETRDLGITRREVVEPYFSHLVLKVHGHCNLACDYCYMYEMADQTWRTKAMRMDEETFNQAIDKFSDHTRRHNLNQVEVTLHGGEPLLVGAERLRAMCQKITASISDHAWLRLSMQTNGILLKDPAILEVLQEFKVKVGVSLDGAQTTHDRHRIYRNGRGSFTDATEGIAALQAFEDHRGGMFSGILCVMDLENDPVETYDALAALKPPNLDFLLPLANWENPPPGREPDSPHTPYADWLLAAHKAWKKDQARRFGAPRIRLFEALSPSSLSVTETLGLAPARMVVVDTNGAIEQVDTLKSAYEGAPNTGLNVANNTFEEALEHPGVLERRLGLAALSQTCQECPIVAKCGGGYYPHRYKDGHFRNPSVYCTDLKKLVPVLSKD